MCIEVTHGAVEFSENRHVRKLLFGSLQALHNIRQFFAHRCRAGGLAMCAREHWHRSKAFCHTLQLVTEHAHFRAQYVGARRTQH